MTIGGDVWNYTMDVLRRHHEFLQEWEEEKAMMKTGLHYVSTDEQWSRAVADRDKKCRWLGCGRRFGLGAHHIVPRSEYTLRRCLENGILACEFHHSHWETIKHAEPDKYEREMVILIGRELWDMLQREHRKLNKLRHIKKEKHSGSSEVDLV